MQKLYDAGADIPKPLAMRGNVVLMAYLGDEEQAAPMLTDVRLDPVEALPHFETLIRNVALFLSCHCIHGDLFAYNVMLHEGRVFVIDFPQIVDSRGHRDAYNLLQRDVDRLCRYFNRYDLNLVADAITADLWRRYTSNSLHTDCPDTLAPNLG